ncbi:MAG: hypothetical protein ACLPYZ_06110 [Limisphaerales bacterium]
MIDRAFSNAFVRLDGVKESNSAVPLDQMKARLHLAAFISA